MSTLKATPGPWEAIKGIEQSDDMRCGVAAVRGDTRYLVATIENGAPGDFCDTEFANANLMAAAPELYTALSDLVSTSYSSPDWRDVCTNAMDALAKARGEL